MIKNILFQIGSTLVAISVLVYLILHTMSSFENELEIKNVYYTTMDLTYDSTAYIFREESILTDSKSGYALYDFENGEKIKINQKVASLYSDSSSYEAKKQIKAFEKEIETLKAIINEVEYSTPSITELDKTINGRIESISSFASNGDLKNSLLDAYQSIRELNLKYSTLNSTEECKKLIKAYEEEIDKLSSSVSSSSVSIYSPLSGYFYNEADGYENIFTFEKVEKLSASVFDELKNSTPEDISHYGKVVKSSRWYIAFELKTAEAINFAPNQKYTVTFPSSDRKIEMLVEKRIDASDEDKKILVLSSNTIMSDFNFSRKQIVTITVATYSGLAFPASAIHTDYDSTGANKAGVYVLDETIVKFKTFERIMEKNGYILCAVPDSTNISKYSDTELSLFDSVITEGTNLYHKKVIKNVLKAK